MDESSEVIRILSGAVMYEPLKNPSPTEQIVKQWERRYQKVVGTASASAFSIAVALGPLQGRPMFWADWPPVYAWLLLLCPLVGYFIVDPIILSRRRAYRATDEAHHQLARWAVHERQVMALAVHSAAILEDMEDQYRARLARGLGRLSVLVGDRAAIITTALGVLGIYKFATDARWIVPGSAAIGPFLVLAGAMTVLPMLMRAVSEPLNYQCDLLAAARKRKTREVEEHTAKEPLEVFSATTDVAARQTPTATVTR